MTVMAAVTLGGFFSACSSEMEDSQANSPEFNIVQNYEKAFVTRFGEPAETQTWGFGEKVAGTRANNPGVDVPYTSDDINANANEWADPTPGKTFGGWVVPDPLTDAQKELVRKYFQAVPNLTYDDPKWRHFFIQQVYKGHDNPPTTGNGEVTVSAGGTGYTSDNMNLLTVGHNEQHINDFNSGTASSKGVLDKGYTANDFGNHHHSDQISLMVNIDDTECFGYHNTGASLQRNDKAALVGWETIRTWARQQKIYTEDILNDGWNRSFMGFDFELYSLEDSYAKDNSGNKIYALINEVPGNALQYIWNGSKVVKRGTAPAAVRKNNTRAGTYVQGNYYHRVKVGDNPEDGHVEYLYAGSELIGKITYGGTGDAAISTEDWGGFTAKIYRPYIKFTALNTAGNLYFTQDKHENDGCECIVWDETTNTKKAGGVINWDNWYIGGTEGGHTYKFYYSTGADVGFYGLYYEVWGQSIADPDGETGNGGQGSGDNNQGSGDNNQGGGNNNQGSGDNNQGSGDNNQGGGDNNQGSGDNNQSEEDYDYYGEDIYIIIDGKKIPYLNANMNMYSGDVRTLSDSDMKISKDGKECLNLPAFKALFDEGYLPVQSKDLRTWVKWQGCDGYFSDWIVTLTNAKKTTTPPPPTGFVCRIIAEDLTVGENSDFDFNDVVFDVIEGGTKIRLRAAGGELPLYVAGQEVHDAFATKYSGITRTTLINTGWNGPVDYENYYVDISSGGTYSTRALAETIPIVVHKNGRQITLKAEKAKVASKIAVGSDFEWCSEREDIDKKFRKKDYTKLFQQYVRGISPYNNDDWTSGKTWYQYRGE